MELELRSKAIRERLGHPVIDADGHYIEFGPSILEFMKETAGARVADAFVELNDRIAKSIGMTTHQRRDSGIAQEGFLDHTGEEHVGPGGGDDAAAPTRTAGRIRVRLHGAVSIGGAVGAAARGRGDEAGVVPRVQLLSGGSLP
jgi:hypothetical protein